MVRTAPSGVGRRRASLFQWPVPLMNAIRVPFTWVLQTFFSARGRPAKAPDKRVL